MESTTHRFGKEHRWLQMIIVIHILRRFWWAERQDWKLGGLQSTKPDIKAGILWDCLFIYFLFFKITCWKGDLETKSIFHRKRKQYTKANLTFQTFSLFVKKKAKNNEKKNSGQKCRKVLNGIAEQNTPN